MANVLIIGGFGMSLNVQHNDARIDDGSAYWGLANRMVAAGHNVTVRECLETGEGSDKVSPGDVLDADVIVSYSYGTASLKEIWHDFAKQIDKRVALWVIVAGVPDAWMAQYYGTLWHKPPFVDRAVCFQVADVPASCDLQNTLTVGIDSFVSDGTSTADINVDCNGLFPPLMAPGDKHKGIKESPQVLQAIAQLILATAAPGAFAPAADGAPPAPTALAAQDTAGALAANVTKGGV